jgi:plastocyanin
MVPGVLNTRSFRAAIAVLLLAAFAVGCADDKADSSSGSGDKVDIPTSKFEDDTGKKEAAVSVVDNSFESAYVLVTAGTKVVWTNDGRNQHNVQPVTPDAFAGVATTDFAPGQSHAATFDKPGDYPYYCSIHGTKNLSGQSGVIRVVAADAS